MEITVFNERQDILQKCGSFSPIALRAAKTLWSFCHSECNRVKILYRNGHSNVRFD